MNLRGNKKDKSFTLKLANGKEKSFRSGPEMHAWYMKNRDAIQHRKSKRPKRRPNNKKQ